MEGSDSLAGTAACTALLVLVYIFANLSCIVFFAHRGDLRAWLHIVLPLVGILALVPILCASLGIGASVLPFVSPLPGPAAYAGLFAGLWMALGVVVLVVRSIKSRR